MALRNDTHFGYSDSNVAEADTSLNKVDLSCVGIFPPIGRPWEKVVLVNLIKCMCNLDT